MPITVAIPTYCRCNSVVNLVKSLLPQLDKDDELLVIDDASQDQTSEVLSNIPKVRLITNQSNEGMVKTWNQCLIEASNDWICLIHDDDTPTDRAIGAIRRACSLVGEPALIGHNTSEFNSDNSFCYRVVEPGALAILQCFLPSGVTIHKSIIDAVGLYNEKFVYSPDLEYFSRICSKFVSITIESPRIIYFNLHGNNHEFKTWLKPDFISQLEEIEKISVSRAGLTEESATRCFNQRMNSHISWMLQQSPKSSDSKLLKTVCKMIRNKPYIRSRYRFYAYTMPYFNWPREF